MSLAARVTIPDVPRAALRVASLARRTGVDSWTAADHAVLATLDRVEGTDPAQVAARLERFGMAPAGMSADEVRAKGLHVAASVDGDARLSMAGGAWSWEARR